MKRKDSTPDASLGETCKILVADSETGNRDELRRMLVDKYEIVEADDRLRALEIIEKDHGAISLVLVDLTMAKTGNFEILRRMQEKGWTEQIPVVVVAAESTLENTEEIYDFGVMDYIRRPFDANVLCHRVDNLIRLCEKQGQRRKWSIERYLEAILCMDPDVVGTFNFNISKNICSGGRSDIETVNMLQKSGTLDGYIKDALPLIPEEEERQAFVQTFGRENLLREYDNGNTMVLLKHKYIDDNNEKRLLLSTLDMMENPVTGDIEGVVYTRDITKKYVEDMISEFLIQKGYDTMWVIDLPNDKFSMLSRNFGDMGPLVKCEHSFSVGRELIAKEHVAPEDQEKFMMNTDIEVIRKKIAGAEPYAFNVHCIEESGERRFKKYSYYYLNKRYEIVLATVEDITFEIERDFLTGELNREGFLQYVRNVLDRSSQEEKYAILFIDVKGFKALNEIFGTEAGDEMLRQIPSVLRESFLEPEAICRITGYDHFLCLVRQDRLEAKKLQQILHHTFSQGRKTAEIYCQCGIYNIDRNSGLSVSMMCDRARLAKDYVKDDYLKSYAVYEEAMKDDYLAKNEVTGMLQSALHNKEFKIFYQPIYDAATGKIASAEALIRWDRPGVGMVSPAVFIPALEESGYVSQLDMYVAQGVKEFIMNRRKENKFVVPVSVNLSWVDFHDKSMMDTLVCDIEKRKTGNEFVRYEITETAYTALSGDNGNIIKRMRNSGTSILIDDFGSGYSSFSTIMEFDFDVIKLDMGFIQKIGINAKSESIINAIIDMAHHINAKVIAEGAETKEQVNFLRKNGCDYIQGFYYSRPLPQEEFTKLLDRQAV